eukprot:m.54475 g.54475  ORF g.54475 m.54475 type:complete len:113 (-) comp18519_c0_seq1:149-487(-)
MSPHLSRSILLNLKFTLLNLKSTLLNLKLIRLNRNNPMLLPRAPTRPLQQLAHDFVPTVARRTREHPFVADVGGKCKSDVKRRGGGKANKKDRLELRIENEIKELDEKHHFW